MREYWPVLLAVGVIAVAWRLMRSRPRRQGDERSIAMPRVEGFQVSGPLHPRMTRACVFDLGLQYGKGFRRKEAPALPHGPDCQCRTVPFAFSGAEVFTGSLRRFAEVGSALPGFPQEACRPLLEALKRMNADPLPETLTEYLALAGLEQTLPADQREPVRRFLTERFAYLSHQRAAEGAAAPAAQPTDAV